MKQPLKLTWYWPVNCGAPCRCNVYQIGNRVIPDYEVDIWSKRLMDPELAAEYWQAGYADERYDREDEDLEPIPEIISRFATHPHYDEPTP